MTKYEIGWPLVIDQPFAEKRPERLRGQSVVATDDGRHHALSALLVRHADDDGFSHAGAFVDHPLDHLGIDVESVGDDQIIFRPTRVRNPDWVAAAQVAGIEPAGSKSLASRLRLSPVFTKQG